MSINNDDDIVISGMSGMFPSSRNVKDFEMNLYNKINMVNDDESRWKHVNTDVPRFSGKLPDISHFDATFFGVHQVQAENMDPQNRILIEESFKAVLDAGINPSSMRGSNTGVYIGSCISESENHLYYSSQVPSGFGVTGASKAMFANRISYGLGLTGPSVLCDSACSSSLYALDLAYNAFRMGTIDAAIIGGSQLCLHPSIAMHFAALGILSLNGHCCPFDANANGYTRSETISCIFLQRRSAAKRVYATVVHCQTNCDGFKPEGITYPSSFVQEKLLKQVYAKANMDISDLGYLEAHSTGTVVGDPEECKAIDGAICRQRRDPLLIGSVKSNCGHAEAGSGMCALIKVCIAMQNNLIPPNINYKNLRSELEAIRAGRLCVVSEPTKLPKPYVGVNSFGFGGANGHVVLKQFEKEKTMTNLSENDVPRLVTWASRTEENLNFFFTDLEGKIYDEDYLALVQNAQSGGIQGMVFRGYGILKSLVTADKPVLVNKSIQHNGGVKRPLVWVFSGMGSQWVGMGKSLMQLPLFKQAIQRCHNILKPLGVDLIKIVTYDDRLMFENILHSFVGIAAIQIALVNILRDLGLSPDYIIGHSVGELGCAYADNCFTEEQMILAAYYRGKVSLDLDKIKGSMAAVGLGFKDVKPLLPDTIEVACHNSADSCTISGPAADIAKFVQQLKSKDIFAKEVQCSNIAYHSRYIAHLGPVLLKHLREIIPNPVERSSKWICSSVPKSKWMQLECKYSSAEYHTNNLLSSVLFEEASTSIPKNALTIEIAPHSLLQSILKSSVGEGVHIGLTKRNNDDNMLFFLNALGSLYINGVELNIEKLYPAPQWPVSRGTPSLSHLIDFDHSREYFVYKYSDSVEDTGIKSYVLKPSDKHKYLLGHEIDGRVLVPATFYLECVWRTFAITKGIPQFENLSVEFQNIKFVRATTLAGNDTTELVVVIQKGTGKFEVTESHSLVVSGIIRDIVGKPKPSPMLSDVNQESVPLTKKDFYKELKLRGYHYNGGFQGVEMALADGSYGKVKWTQNWVTFMDCMLQMSIVGYDSRHLKLPTKLRTLRIYPQYHQSLVAPEDFAEVFSNNKQKKIISGGIEIIGLNASTVQRRKAPGEPVLETYQFISHFPAPKLGLNNIARCCIQLVLENLSKTKLQVVELSDGSQNSEFLLRLKQSIGDLPLVTGNFFICHKNRDDKIEEEIQDITHLYPDDDLTGVSGNIVVVNGSELVAVIDTPIIKNMDSNDFLIVRNRLVEDFQPMQDLTAIAYFPAASETFILLQKTQNTRTKEDVTIFKISTAGNSFKWLKQLQDVSETARNLILVSYNEPENGIMGLVNCLRKEPTTSNTRCFIINDPKAPAFDIANPFYGNQLKLGLSLNVYQKGSWGTYRHLLLKQEYLPSPQSDNVYGNILRIGDFSSLKWLQGPLLTKEKSPIKIVYSSLNFRDVMLASGRLTIDAVAENRIDQTCVFGLEFSGIDVESGKRVMGMVAKAAVSSHVQDRSNLIWEIPEQWSLRAAATVPVVYLTVYYAFFFTTDIRKGKTILIHAGSGGIGIAAIRVAIAYGLEVFTTVSTMEKKTFLLTTFPTLKENNIGNSRDISFEEMIMDRTQGKGVDFVLNSLSEEKLLASVRCLGKKGHFLEIGKFDMANDNRLGLGEFLNELSFHAVLADNLLTADTELIENLRRHINGDIQNGIIQPLPSTVYPAHELEQAFRFLMSGKHIGKVLLQIREKPDSDVTLPISVLPKIFFSPDLVYVVPGGLGGFGLELVDWMILRDARKIVLSSSRGISNSYQQLRISLWKNYGCEVVINTSNIGTENGCLELLLESLKLGPIGGIFNLAVLLKDSIFPNQTVELFQQSFAPKAYATKYLDQISRKLCPQLQHFVIFSSVSCGRGNAGQSNYGMANSVMERIIEDRVAHGLPGKAVQWGAVGEVGLVAELAAGKIDLEIGGTLQQRISSCLDVLDTLLSTPDPIVASMVVAEKHVNSSEQSPIDFVLNTMSIQDIKSISMSATLAEIGMDSLMAVELKQGLERDYDILLSAAELRSLTFAKLMELSDCYKGKENKEAKETGESGDFEESMRLLYYYIGNYRKCNNAFDHVNNLEDGLPIIIFPGIDGYSGEIWRSIGASLKYPTYVLQFYDMANITDIQGLVDFSYKNITQFLSGKSLKNFKIVAYSFGATIAQMTVELLEAAGYRGKVMFIDGSRSWLECIVKSIKNIYTDEEYEKLIMRTILNIMVPSVTLNKITLDLREKQKHEYLQYIIDTLQQHQIKDIDYILQYIKEILLKINFIQHQNEKLKSNGIIQSPIKLVKPTILTINDFDQYYGLAPFTRNTIQTETLEGNHQTILQNQALPDIINQYFN